MSIYDNKSLSYSLDLSILSVNFSYVCFIYAEIFEKSLDVSFSIC